jgi:hypothetical protein
MVLSAPWGGRSEVEVEVGAVVLDDPIDDVGVQDGWERVIGRSIVDDDHVDLSEVGVL